MGSVADAGQLEERTLIGAIDQGTTSTRFIVFDERGAVVALHQTEFEQHHPKAGWAEHDPFVLLSSVRTCMEQTAVKLMAKGISPKSVKAIGITNQRETTVVWDAKTGQPLHNAIVWLDTRTANTVDHLLQKIPGKNRRHFAPKCGLPIATYFSAVKLRWLLDHVEAVRKASAEGHLLFGTVDSWLIWNLTGGINGGIHATDVTNASRTLLMNLHTLKWDEELCQFFGIDMRCLPTIRPSSYQFGVFSDGTFKGTTISGCLGDQQAALVGHRCFEVGQAKNTYGTGCFMLFNTGKNPVESKAGLLTTVAYQFGDKSAHYALEGSIAIAGASIKWLRDNMKMIKDAEECSQLAAQVTDTAGVYFVPAFSGLFAPYWRDDARGVIVGMSQYTTNCHIARATLEAICFQTREVLDAMNSDSGHPLAVLKVDGGVTNSDLCMRIQADILGLPVERPAMREITALGAAYAAGLAVGIWPDESALQPPCLVEKFEAELSPEVREIRYRHWKKAVQRSLNWIDLEEEED